MGLLLTQSFGAHRDQRWDLGGSVERAAQWRPLQEAMTGWSQLPVMPATVWAELLDQPVPAMREVAGRRLQRAEMAAPETEASALASFSHDARIMRSRR